MNPANDIHYALRLPPKVHTALKRIGKQDDRSLNWIIVRACEEFVARRSDGTKEK